MSSDLFKMARPPSPLGVRLVEAYKNRGITNKREISESLGFKSENAIYKVLSGDRELSFDSLRRFAQATGQSIHWLLTGEVQRESDDRLAAQSSGLASRLRQTFPGMSAEQVGELLQIPTDQVEGYFVHGNLPATEVLARIADQTGVSVTWLLQNKGPQWIAPIAQPGGETQRLSKEDGSEPRVEAVRPSPELTSSEIKVLSAQMTLMIEQQNRTIHQSDRIIQLLEMLVQKNY